MGNPARKDEREAADNAAEEAKEKETPSPPKSKGDRFHKPDGTLRTRQEQLDYDIEQAGG